MENLVTIPSFRELDKDEPTADATDLALLTGTDLMHSRTAEDGKTLNFGRIWTRTVADDLHLETALGDTKQPNQVISGYQAEQKIISASGVGVCPRFVNGDQPVWGAEKHGDKHYLTLNNSLVYYPQQECDPDFAHRLDVAETNLNLNWVHNYHLPCGAGITGNNEAVIKTQAVPCYEYYHYNVVKLPLGNNTHVWLKSQPIEVVPHGDKAFQAQKALMTTNLDLYSMFNIQKYLTPEDQHKRQYFTLHETKNKLLALIKHMNRPEIQVEKTPFGKYANGAFTVDLINSQQQQQNTLNTAIPAYLLPEYTK